MASTERFTDTDIRIQRAPVKQLAGHVRKVRTDA
jgi:hypothetical protein